MSEKTPEDRRHEIRLLAVGFLLTTVAGTLLTFVLQIAENRQKAAADALAAQEALVEKRRDQQTELFKELSPLLDKRLYRWRRVAWGLEDSIPKPEMDDRLFRYRDAFISWNESLNRNRALVCRFFGPETGEQFEQEIIPRFVILQDTINKLLKIPPEQRPRLAPGSLNSLADSLNQHVYRFNNRMAEIIRSGVTRDSDPGSRCDFSPSTSSDFLGFMGEE